MSKYPLQALYKAKEAQLSILDYRFKEEYDDLCFKYRKLREQIEEEYQEQAALIRNLRQEIQEQANDPKS